MYTDKIETVEFIADYCITDQIIDWFGLDIDIENCADSKVKVRLKVSPHAMEHWAMQYIGFVEILKPVALRDRIKNTLTEAMEKYR